MLTTLVVTGILGMQAAVPDGPLAVKLRAGVRPPPGAVPIIHWPLADPEAARAIGLDRWYWMTVPPPDAEVVDPPSWGGVDLPPQQGQAPVQGPSGQIRTFPNDPDIPLQWALSKVQAFDAWQIQQQSSLIVAVLDSGVSPHVDLAPLLPGWAFDGGGTEDLCNHGTHVAGILGALTNNSVGIAGMVWGADVVSVRVLAGCGGTETSYGQGIIWAADNADIANSSLQYYQGTQFLRDALDYAASRGLIMVAATGNSVTAGVIAWPARHPGVIAVGATDQADDRASFSNSGPQIDLVAPGVQILSLHSNGSGFLNLSGTSMASPHVAGAAALVMATRPGADVAFIRRTLATTAVDLGTPGWDAQYGWGRLDLHAMLRLADCPANCDRSTIEPVLNVDDFSCFINAFAAASLLPPERQIDHYANCDGSTTSPVLNVDDFTCFINEFAAGCPGQ